MKRRLLVLQMALRIAEHLGAGCLIETRPSRSINLVYGIEKPYRSRRIDVIGIGRIIETHFDMSLRSKIVNLVRLHVLHQPVGFFSIGHVATLQRQPMLSGPAKTSALEPRKLRSAERRVGKEWA